MNEPFITEAELHAGEENLPPVRSPEYGLTPSPRTVIISILAYCVLHYLIRLMTSPVFALNEAEQLLMSQSLTLGYHPQHAPLVSWIYAISDMLFGSSRPVFFAVKYIIMAVGLVAFYYAARIVFQWYEPHSHLMYARNDLSAAATASWALVYFSGLGTS